MLTDEFYRSEVNYNSNHDYKNVHFAAVHGSLNFVTGHCLVIPSNPQYVLEEPFVHSFLQYSGNEFSTKMREAIQAIRKRGRNARNNDKPLKVDTYNIEQIDGVSLPHDLVIVQPVRRSTRSSLRVMYRQALRLGIDSKCHMVVIPLRGWGGNNLSDDKIVQAFVGVLQTFTNFGRINFLRAVDYDQHLVTKLDNALKDLASASVPLQSATPLIPFLSPEEAAAPEDFESVFSEPDIEDSLEERRKIFDEVPVEKVKADNCVICIFPLKGSTTLDGRMTDNARSKVVELRICHHQIHGVCLNKWFAQKRQCPLCKEPYHHEFGLQPRNIEMQVLRFEIPGRGKFIRMKFIAPSGIQNSDHIRPGHRYPSFSCKAYLIDDTYGFDILQLFRHAFTFRKLITIGDDGDKKNVPIFAVRINTNIPEMAETGPEITNTMIYHATLQEFHNMGIKVDQIIGHY